MEKTDALILVSSLSLAFTIAIHTRPAAAQAPKKPASAQAKIDAVRERKDRLAQDVMYANKNKACDADGSCEVMEMGARNCGGPSEYLIVSTANPRISEVKSKAAEYTAVEKELNIVDPPMDCTPLPPAPEAHCDKNLCVGRKGR